MEGSKIILPCAATGSSNLEFKWLTAKDNKPVNVGAEDVWIATDGQSYANLTLNKVFVSDSGGFRCVVTGKSGSSSAVTMVTINRKY